MRPPLGPAGGLGFPMLLFLAAAGAGPFRAGEPEASGKPREPLTRGPANAAVTIIEFTDFECPFSKRAAPALRQAVERYPGQVRWVFKHFPLPFHHRARILHEAAEAAGEWGRFWEMRERLLFLAEPPDRAACARRAARRSSRRMTSRRSSTRGASPWKSRRTSRRAGPAA